MADNWRCEHCKREILSTDNTHSEDGITLHSWCYKKYHSQKGKEVKHG